MTRALGPILLVAGWLAIGASCGRDEPSAGPGGQTDPDRRRAEIRRLIEKNLHFNLHGFQRVVDERTGPAVRPFVTEDDIPILATFLGNSEQPNVIQMGAAAVLVELGEPARPVFTRMKERGWVHAWWCLQELDRRKEAGR